MDPNRCPPYPLSSDMSMLHFYQDWFYATFFTKNSNLQSYGELLLILDQAPENLKNAMGSHLYQTATQYLLNIANDSSKQTKQTGQKGSSKLDTIVRQIEEVFEKNQLPEFLDKTLNITAKPEQQKQESKTISTSNGHNVAGETPDEYVKCPSIEQSIDPLLNVDYLNFYDPDQKVVEIVHSTESTESSLSSLSSENAKCPTTECDYRTRCVFCPSETHSSEQCTEYVGPMERIARAMELDRCTLCLVVGHRKEVCPQAGQIQCDFCFGLPHLPLMYH